MPPCQRRPASSDPPYLSLSSPQLAFYSSRTLCSNTPCQGCLELYSKKTLIGLGLPKRGGTWRKREQKIYLPNLCGQKQELGLSN